MPMKYSLRTAVKRLTTADLSAEALVGAALHAIRDSELQGGLAFLEVNDIKALEEARTWDLRRQRGENCPLLAGVPVSIKDCIDTKGAITKAGSVVLANETPAAVDAGIVSVLRNNGAVIIGRANMTEFAYSGLGKNAHYGTPLSDVKRGRVSGGSSSGGAVSVAEGMALVSIGTDTSGSVRIPAAFCGVAGFRPSQGRYPIDGIIPLAPSFDVVGTMAKYADCLQFLDDILCPGQANRSRDAPTRFFVPEDLLMNSEADVVAPFCDALGLIKDLGFEIETGPLPELTELSQCVVRAQIVAFEAFSWHRDLLSNRGQLYDPQIAMRLAAADKIPRADYENGLHELKRLRKRVDQKLTSFDGLLLPTVPIFAPTLSSIEDDTIYLEKNSASFRHTSIANHLDLPSVSIPIGQHGGSMVPIMIIGKRRHDAQTLQLSRILETKMRNST